MDRHSYQWEPKIQKLKEDQYALTLEMDPSELKSKQERLNQEFLERTPSIFGAPNCNRDNSPIDTPKRRAFQKYMKEEFGPRFASLAKTDLRAFEELLMTEPLGLWNSNELEDEMHGEVLKNPAALKVMYAVLKSRYQSGDVDAYRRWIDTFDGTPGYTSDGDSYWDPVPVDLPRPLALRSLPKSMARFDSKEAEDIFMSIYNGIFDVKWMAGSRDEHPDEVVSFSRHLPPEANFKFSSLTAFAQNRSEVMTTNIVIMPMPGNPNQAATLQTFNTEDPYKSMFTVEQKSILSHRLVHWCVFDFSVPKSTNSSKLSISVPI